MAIEKTITEEPKKNAIDLVITMVVDELSEDLRLQPEEILIKFLSSNTGILLYDEDTKLWWDGPSAVADMYKKEISE